MATFVQWWKAFQKNPKVHQHYWLCGSEPVLVDDVLASIKTNYPVNTWNYRTLVVGVESEEVIWQTLFSRSIDSKEMLTIVRRADELKDKTLIPKLVESKSPLHVVVFISSEEKVERFKIETSDGSRKTIPPDHLTNFEKSGKIVECGEFTQATSKVGVEWIKTKVEAKEGALVHLLNSTEDLKLVRDVLAKLIWLKEPATKRSIDYFLHDSPNTNFVDALISMDKETAMKALSEIDRDSYLKLIGQLDAQVDLSGRIHDLISERKRMSDIMKSVGNQGFLVPKLYKAAQHYSLERRLKIRILLSEVDRRLRSGTLTGAMESLVVLW